MNDKLKELYARRWSVIRKKLLSFNSENLSNEKHRATNPLSIGAFRRSQIDDEFSEKELCKLQNIWTYRET